MKISVIMGVYNCEDRVISAIDSIQKQTFTDWEFIICDDCSTDNTYEKLLEYSKSDNRLTILKNEHNMRLAYTLNRCLEVAKGEYIARMDDDDYSYSERFGKQVEFLDNNPEYDFVSSGVDIYDGEKIISHNKPQYITPRKEDFLWNTCFVHPATMFRATKLREVNGYRVAKETRRTEDFDLFTRMYAKGMQGYNLSSCLLRYYVNPFIMTEKRKYKYRVDAVIVRYKRFKELGLLPKGLLYVIKPLIVGLIPNKMLYKLHNKSIE